MWEGDSFPTPLMGEPSLGKQYCSLLFILGSQKGFVLLQTRTQSVL